MPTTSSFIVFVLICFMTLASCSEPKLNGTTIIWNDDFEKDSSEGSTLKTEYDAKGLQPWYDFVNSFISTVLNKEPYGKSSYTVYCYFAFISCPETGDNKVASLRGHIKGWLYTSFKMLTKITEQVC